MLTQEEAFSPGSIFDLAKHQHELAIVQVDRMTEAWLRKAIEAGPGVNLARSGPIEDGFSIKYEFQLIQPGADPELRMPCTIFKQPDLTDGERARLLAGRSDWREDQWQDECGVPDCEHDCCAVFWGRKAPTVL